MPKALNFQFTQEQAQLIVAGLDALGRANGIQSYAAIAEVNAAIQAQAQAQLQQQAETNVDHNHAN